MLEDWCKRAKASNLEIAKSGVDIPGYMLTKRSGAKEVRSVPILVAQLQEQGRDKEEIEDIILRCSSVSVTDLGKILTKGEIDELIAEKVIVKKDDIQYLRKKK